MELFISLATSWAGLMRIRQAFGAPSRSSRKIALFFIIVRFFFVQLFPRLIRKVANFSPLPPSPFDSIASVIELQSVLFSMRAKDLLILFANKSVTLQTE